MAQPWRSLGAGESATLEWADWFNHRRRRLLGPIGAMPPAEAEALYYAALYYAELEATALAA